MTKQELLAVIDRSSAEILEVCRQLWKQPEVAGQEQASAQLLRDTLRQNGFVIVDIPAMPHAFCAEFGAGAPVLAVLGEYDALPGLSQSCQSHKEPLTENGAGHGCGHNLLGSAALGAALALKAYLEESGQSGTVRFYGCPEEETLSGKPAMIARHVFDGCDAALSWHPMTANVPYEEAYLANTSLRFYFKGKTAHAAFAPHLGRSALDAVELMNVGANYLREHIIDKARMHYTTNSCGFPPNIVPDRAEAWYFVRAPHMSDVDGIVARLAKVAQGAAMMTETEVRWETVSSCCEMLPNRAMEELTRENMTAISGPVYTEEEVRFAQEILSTLSPEQLCSERDAYGCGADAPALYSGVAAREVMRRAPLCGSSDSGDVSYLMPMNLFTTACAPLGAAAHSWVITACAGGSIGEKGMLYAAKILAGVGYDLLTEPARLDAAKADFQVASAARPYTPAQGE